jgi:hypothetical protein
MQTDPQPKTLPRRSVEDEGARCDDWVAAVEQIVSDAEASQAAATGTHARDRARFRRAAGRRDLVGTGQMS